METSTPWGARTLAIVWPHGCHSGSASDVAPASTAAVGAGDVVGHEGDLERAGRVVEAVGAVAGEQRGRLQVVGDRQRRGARVQLGVPAHRAVLAQHPASTAGAKPSMF